MMDMIQRLIGVTIGAIVTLILLVAMTTVTVDAGHRARSPSAPSPPGLLADRHRLVSWAAAPSSASEDKIEDEVQRQVNQQNRS